MRMNKIRKKRYIITLVLLLLLGIGLFSFGFKERKDIKYTYVEDNSVDYKVYLKENKFFDEPYLEKNKTYITSLIDYIDADFSYKIDFNEPVSGDLSYKIIGEIKADKNNNDVGNYWTKQYDLTDKQTSTISNNRSHEIKLNQKIDYNNFNDILNSFIEEYKLPAESTLNIYMEVKGDVIVDKTNDKMNVDSKVCLTVPLSKLAIEGKIEADNNNTQKEIIKEAEPVHRLLKILFYIDVLVFVYNLFGYVKFLINKNNNLSYRDKIKKLNSDYEDIITNVKSMDTDKFSIINVEDFEDLLSVYNSIREPINFLYGAQESKFFIIKENACYMYTIKKED